MKKTLAILLAILMAFSVCTFAFAEGDEPAAVPTSGKCGENINWSLINGVLTITGTGAVKPLTREVEKEVYVDSYQDLETGDWVDGHYETQTVEESYYPWSDAIEANILAQFGVEDFESLFMKLYYGGSVKEIYTAMLTAVSKLVIGEGITSVDKNAFSGEMFDLMPRSIILPSTLTSLGDGISAGLATELVVNNPKISFETAPVGVSGYAGEVPWKTLDDAFNGMLDAVSVSYGMELIDMIFSVVAEVSELAQRFANAIAEVNADESMPPEEKVQLIAEYKESEQGYVAELQEYYDYTGATFAEIIVEGLARLNAILGTEFKSADEIYVTVPGQCDCEICDCCQCGDPCDCEDCDCCDCAEDEIQASEAFMAALEAYEAKAEAAGELMEKLTIYMLGTKPEEVNDSAVISLTPTPWLTVYGAKNSTTQAACGISKVRFVALEDAKAAFDAEKAAGVAAADAQAQDSDSDASKALIDGAKSEIDAIAYDETKTPSENINAAKAAADTINTKLAGDLAAQRKADKDEDGGYSNNAFMKFIKKIIEFFKGIFDKITGIFKK